MVRRLTPPRGAPPILTTFCETLIYLLICSNDLVDFENTPGHLFFTSPTDQGIIIFLRSERGVAGKAGASKSQCWKSMQM